MLKKDTNILPFLDTKTIKIRIRLAQTKLITFYSQKYHKYPVLKKEETNKKKAKNTF